MAVKTLLGKALLISLFILGLPGCGGNGTEPSTEDNGKDREVILTHWVDNIIVPSYAAFKLKFDVMHTKADAFIEQPNNISLTEFRSAWADAYVEWQKVELFQFGPADQYTLRNFFNIYPADVSGIESNIANASANLDLPSAYARQGFPALDYLINGVADNLEGAIAYYTTHPDADKRRAYIEKIISRMKSLLTNVISEWSGTYRNTFVSKTGLDIGSSFGQVVNAYVLHYERYIRSGKIGIPSGATIASGGESHPENVEAFYNNGISLTLVKNAHQAAKNFFNGANINTGAEGPSLKSYLDALQAKDASTGTLLSDIINNQFILIDSKLNALPASLYEAVQTNNHAMVDTYVAMQGAVRMLKVDMTSAMSITITYTDNDGD